MPIDKAKVQKLIDAMDKFLEQREKDRLAGIDEDEDDCYDINNPLEAPPQQPFGDSPPSRIHGEPKRDLFK
jgi:hypothetical protein